MTEYVEHHLTHPAGTFRVVVRDDHTCAAVYGTPKDGCLVRIHTRCRYPEVFDIEGCGCHQLDHALDLIETEGVLVYLEHQRFEAAAELLHHLGFTSVRLLTDNPAKIAVLRSAGIHVTPVSLKETA